MSPELLGGIREVLTTRPRLRKWISPETATLFVDTIETLVDLVDDPDQVQTETRDPNDDYLIALARTHEADVIVSGDKDPLDWEPQSPPVVTPAQFESRVGATERRPAVRSDDVNDPLVTAPLRRHVIAPRAGDRGGAVEFGALPRTDSDRPCLVGRQLLNPIGGVDLGPRS